MDDGLDVTETALAGAVEDPTFGDEGFDLSSRPVSATARYIGLRCDQIEIRIEPAHDPTAGCNNAILRLFLDGESVNSARATLIQATDTAAYEPCRRRRFNSARPAVKSPLIVIRGFNPAIACAAR